MRMKSSIRRLSRKTLVLGLLVTAGISTMGVAAAVGADAPKQQHVVPQVQAAPGSGKGIVIGYATSLEAVPIVHVISTASGAGQAGRRELIFCDTGRRPRQGARLRQDDQDAGRQGLPPVPARHEGVALDLQGRPAGRAGVRDRHPAAALPVDLHGRRQRVRRLRRRRQGRPVDQGEVQLPVRRVDLAGAARDRRSERGPHGRLPQGLPVASAPARSRTSRRSASTPRLDKARTLMTDMLTTLPGKKRHHRRVDRRRGHRGRVRRRQGRGPRRRTSGASPWASPTTSPKCGIKTNPNWLASTAISPEKYGWTAIPT